MTDEQKLTLARKRRDELLEDEDFLEWLDEEDWNKSQIEELCQGKTLDHFRSMFSEEEEDEEIVWGNPDCYNLYHAIREIAELEQKLYKAAFANA